MTYITTTTSLFLNININNMTFLVHLHVIVYKYRTSLIRHNNCYNLVWMRLEGKSTIWFSSLPPALWCLNCMESMRVSMSYQHKSLITSIVCHDFTSEFHFLLEELPHASLETLQPCVWHAQHLHLNWFPPSFSAGVLFLLLAFLPVPRPCFAKSHAPTEKKSALVT